VDEDRIPLSGDAFYAAGFTSCPDQNKDQEQERRSCFYCLEGWVFLGSLDYDGEEVFEAVRCRTCGGTGRLA
jgi:hypothetical protein